MKNDTQTPKSNRLRSLDLLRGFDMLFLCVAQPLIVAVAAALGVADATAHPFMRQFHHYWGGFTAYDIIMPLFIFMCGAAVPLALTKRLAADGRPTAAYWKHIAWRVVMLWVLGMAAGGRLLSWDPSRLCYFTNTLQSIAVGYVIAALVLLMRSRKAQVAVTVSLAAAYGLLLHFGGDYSEQGNLAMKVDMFFVNLLQPAGHDTRTYTWYLTSLMFGAMTLCGMHATQILRSDRTPWGKAARLGVYGAALWIGGLVLEWAGVPCIKHIFTVSFTAQAMGVSVLLLDALYVVSDIWGVRRGWWLVTLYGQTALAAYILGGMLRRIPTAAAQGVFGQLASRIGSPWGSVVTQVGTCLALTFFLWVWRARRK